VDPHTIFYSKGFWRCNVLMDRWMDVQMIMILLLSVRHADFVLDACLAIRKCGIISCVASYMFFVRLRISWR
jgi:hypothetical protein